MDVFVVLGVVGAESGLGGLDVRVVDGDVRAVASALAVANPRTSEKKQNFSTYRALPQLAKGHPSDQNP